MKNDCLSIWSDIQRANQPSAANSTLAYMSLFSIIAIGVFSFTRAGDVGFSYFRLIEYFRIV